MGANCSETHPLMYSFVQHIVAEIEAIEAKQYLVCGKTVTFKCTVVLFQQIKNGRPLWVVS